MFFLKLIIKNVTAMNRNECLQWLYCDKGLYFEYIFHCQVVMEVHPLLHQLDSLLAAEPAKRPAAGAGGGISPGEELIN